MPTYNIHQAKTHLSKLLARAEAGDEVIIARDGRPLVKLVPVTTPKGDRVAGRLAGRVVMGPDFDAWTPDLEDLSHGPSTVEPIEKPKR